MPAIGGVGEIVEAWLRAVVFCEYVLYPGEQASLRVVDLDQYSNEGKVVDEVVRRPHPTSAPTHCHTLTDGEVAIDVAYG